jgi:hypothetical protein
MQLSLTPTTTSKTSRTHKIRKPQQKCESKTPKTNAKKKPTNQNTLENVQTHEPSNMKPKINKP